MASRKSLQRGHCCWWRQEEEEEEEEEEDDDDDDTVPPSLPPLLPPVDPRSPPPRPIRVPRLSACRRERSLLPPWVPVVEDAPVPTPSLPPPDTAADVPPPPPPPPPLPPLPPSSLVSIVMHPSQTVPCDTWSATVAAAAARRLGPPPLPVEYWIPHAGIRSKPLTAPRSAVAEYG